MKIAFLGSNKSINYFHIGGLESLLRRLAKGLSNKGDKIDFIIYGEKRPDAIDIDKNTRQLFFKNLKEALSYIKEKTEHVITIYLNPKDRIPYAFFRKKNKNKILFYHLYSVWSEFRIKRELSYLDGRLYPFNGGVICISPRIFKCLKNIFKKTYLLLPPVDAPYFCDLKEKTNGKRLRVSFLGRLDPNKGINETMVLFKKLIKYPNIKPAIYGYFWPHQPESVKIHEILSASRDIDYIPANYFQWSTDIEKKIIQFLRKTDILFLPYKRLSSSIDTPLLLLEGMASLCAIITPPLGDLQETYGQGNFKVKDIRDLTHLENIIKSAPDWINGERKRLRQRNKSLNFDTKNIVNKFREILRSDGRKINEY